MIRKLFLGAVAILLLASLVAPVFAQSSGTPQITLNHQYRITRFGDGIVNETITFTNNGTSAEQIPAVQVGIPNSIMAYSTGFIVTPSSEYTVTSLVVDNNTIFTITPIAPALATGGSSVVSLESYLTKILTITPGTKSVMNDLVLLSPSLNVEVSTLDLNIVLPTSGSLSPVPAISGVTFNSSATAAPQTYQYSKANVTPQVATQTAVFNATNTADFTPIQIYGVLRTIVPSANGVPQVHDEVSLRNLAYYAVSTLPLNLLAPGIANVTVLPSSFTPTIDPTIVSVSGGLLNLTRGPFDAPVNPGDNFNFTISYPIPTDLITTSGTTVTVGLPYSLPIQGIAENYTVDLSAPLGMSGVGRTMVQVANATGFDQGTVSVSYSVNPGWGADQAVPLAVVVFAAAFILLSVRGPQQTAEEKSEEEAEEEKRATTRLSDVIKALEDKLTLIDESMARMVDKPQGAVPRSDFQKIRSELDSLKSRAMHRLNEAKQSTDSKRLIDVLNQIQEAERDEDRAAKDMLNLFEQYHTRKMKEETYERLLPNYRKRLDAVTNKLSDLLHAAQKESE